MFIKYCLCLILFINVCSSGNTTLPNAKYGMWVPRVVNGKPAHHGDVPYQVSMKGIMNRALKKYKTFCGGTIIGPKKVLTAAHCFDEKGSSCAKIMRPGRASDNTLKAKYAVAGSLLNIATYNSIDGPDGQWRAIHSVLWPKGYKFPKHDIAVAHLKRPFVFNDKVSPILTATRHTDYKGKCLASGFGRTGQSIKDQTPVLLLGHLEIMPKKLCNSVHRKNMDRFVCTSSSFTDVGKGDSGGPLVCTNTGDPNEIGGKGVLVGVVSGHHRGRGSFFTRVSRYQNFVRRSNSMSISKFKYNFGIYGAITVTLIYRTFVLF